MRKTECSSLSSIFFLNVEVSDTTGDAAYCAAGNKK